MTTIQQKLIGIRPDRIRKALRTLKIHPKWEHQSSKGRVAIPLAAGHAGMLVATVTVEEIHRLASWLGLP